MSHRVCPWWLGYLLASPIRRLLQGDPEKILAPFVREGMTVLEPGPGMGFFTLPLARRVGPMGRVVAVGLTDLAGAVDFTLAFALVHELPRVEPFFAEIARASKPGSRLLFAEPAGHVKPADFEAELQVAAKAGFEVAERPVIRRSHVALLIRS
jgi:SAM-dependent methyltransferase